MGGLEINVRMAAEVYAALTDREVQEIEHIALQRREFFGREGF